MRVRMSPVMVALSPAEAGQRLTPESGNGSAGSLPQLTARDLFRECAATTRRIKSLRPQAARRLLILLSCLKIRTEQQLCRSRTRIRAFTLFVHGRQQQR